MKYTAFTLTSKSSSGFTIVELLIAMAVFSVMLLVATTGVIQVGRTYYKGITTTKTQEAARGIVNEISQSIQVGAKNKIEPPGALGPHGAKAVCVGNVRYTYLINAQIKQPYDVSPAALAAGTPTSRHALWVDVRRDGAACKALDLNETIPGETDVTTDPSSVDRRRELLAANMRLTDFKVSELNSQLVEVRARVIYGDHDLSNNGTPLDYSDDVCAPTGLGGQFCAVSELSTFVKKRL